MNAEEINQHCKSPGNYSLYKTIRNGEVVKVLACCGEGGNEYILNKRGLYEWWGRFGADIFNGEYTLENLSRFGIQNVFKQKDNYIWCGCEQLEGNDCLFREGNINKDRFYIGDVLQKLKPNRQ